MLFQILVIYIFKLLILETCPGMKATFIISLHVLPCRIVFIMENNLMIISRNQNKPSTLKSHVEEVVVTLS